MTLIPSFDAPTLVIPTEPKGEARGICFSRICAFALRPTSRAKNAQEMGHPAGDHIERWVGSGLLVAERQFRKVQGYRDIPTLLTGLVNAVSKKTVVEQGKVA